MATLANDRHFAIVTWPSLRGLLPSLEDAMGRAPWGGGLPPSPSPGLLTELIISLMATGKYGVREAIAKAIDLRLALETHSR